MNREIKFRAWDKQRKKYHYPELWDNTMPSNWDEWYILEQYTGLKDKNGKEVYEGDIIQTDVTESLGDIQFSHGVFGVEWWHRGDTMLGAWGQLHNLRKLDDGKVLPQSEVIGNIHNNPELLAQKGVE